MEDIMNSAVKLIRKAFYHFNFTLFSYSLSVCKNSILDCKTDIFLQYCHFSLLFRNHKTKLLYKCIYSLLITINWPKKYQEGEQEKQNPQQNRTNAIQNSHFLLVRQEDQPHRRQQYQGGVLQRQQHDFSGAGEQWNFWPASTL